MKPSDNKQLFLDMQEHPEKYSDQELEAMMDRLDCEPDTQAAWQRFKTKYGVEGESGKPRQQRAGFSMLRKIAAALLFAFTCGALGYATYTIIRIGNKRTQTSIVAPKQKIPHDKTGASAPDSIFRFANVQLDSILSMVGQHYGRQVIFRDNKARVLRLHTTWNSTRPLAEFVEILNEFDVFHLTDEHDTLFVEFIETEEGK